MMASTSQIGRTLMRGIVILNEGKNSLVQVVSDLSIPPVGDEKHGLLIDVKAFGVNRADLLQRMGRYPPPKDSPSSLMGLEAAGIVVQSADPRFPVGTPVMALLSSGGYAEYCVADSRCTLPLPSAGFVGGAATMESYLTAYKALRNICGPARRFRDGALGAKTILWHAGASPLALAALQLIKLANPLHRVIVTVGSSEKAEFCLQRGADVAIEYKQEAFDQAVLRHTEGLGVDLLVDCVGASYWSMNVEALRKEGTMVMLGFLGGSRVQDLDLAVLLRKKLTIVGSSLRDRTVEYKADLISSFASEYAAELASGHLTPHIDSVFDATRVQEAHDRVAANLNSGKVVLTWSTN